MQLKHIEHPEDTIFTGDLQILNWFSTTGKLSLKIDGSPSIVWGTDPECNKFFVGTKSVFNKVKKMICHSHDEIDMLYPDKYDLAEKLHCCLDALPRTTKIYQGDFIGYGGDDLYQPNTIGYLFPDVITHDVIVAPHTEYTVEGNTLLDTVAKPLEHLLCSTYEGVLFMQCNSIGNFQDTVRHRVQFAKQMATIVNFTDKKTAEKLKKTINHCVKCGHRFTEENVIRIAEEHKIDVNLMRLWKLVKSIKMDALAMCENNAWWKSFDGIDECEGEGYVMWNQYGTYKLVNRYEFSRLNFLTTGDWTPKKLAQ